MKKAIKKYLKERIKEGDVCVYPVDEVRYQKIQIGAITLSSYGHLKKVSISKVEINLLKEKEYKEICEGYNDEFNEVIKKCLPTKTT